MDIVFFNYLLLFSFYEAFYNNTNTILALTKNRLHENTELLLTIPYDLHKIITIKKRSDLHRILENIYLLYEVSTIFKNTLTRKCQVNNFFKAAIITQVVLKIRTYRGKKPLPLLHPNCCTAIGFNIFPTCFLTMVSILVPFLFFGDFLYFFFFVNVFLNFEV